MQATTLDAKNRDISGKKVKTLRSEGQLPATVYGKTTKALSLTVDAASFSHTYKQTGETGLINLVVGSETHPVLVKNVQIDPISGLPIHIEFHQVNLKEKIHANIPVELTGESQAVKEKTGTLLQLVNEIEVEALPGDLPERFNIDVTELASVDDAILVKTIPMPSGVTLITDPEIMVAKIGALLAPEPEPTPAEAPENETPGSEPATEPQAPTEAAE